MILITVEWFLFSESEAMEVTLSTSAHWLQYCRQTEEFHIYHSAF